MKASFASRLEEEIPRNMTPTALEADNVEQAGRTPHFRRLEAEQNIQMLKKSLQMSGMKINSALYDSPMTVASADSENIHPNRNVKVFDSQKKALTPINSLTKKAILSSNHHTISWQDSPTPSVNTINTTTSIAMTTSPAASIESTPKMKYAGTPYTVERPAMVKFVDSVGGPLATSLPAPASYSPFSTTSSDAESVVATTAASTSSTPTVGTGAGMQSTPAEPLSCPSTDSNKPQNTPDRLWALLMGGSAQNSPSGVSLDSVSVSEEMSASSIAENCSSLSHASFGSPLAFLTAPPPRSVEYNTNSGSPDSRSVRSYRAMEMSQVTASPQVFAVYSQDKPSPGGSLLMPVPVSAVAKGSPITSVVSNVCSPALTVITTASGATSQTAVAPLPSPVHASAVQRKSSPGAVQASPAVSMPSTAQSVAVSPMGSVQDLNTSPGVIQTSPAPVHTQTKGSSPGVMQASPTPVHTQTKGNSPGVMQASPTPVHTQTKGSSPGVMQASPAVSIASTAHSVGSTVYTMPTAATALSQSPQVDNSVRYTPGEAHASPAASVASTAHSTSPIAHFHYSQSPLATSSTVVAQTTLPSTVQSIDSSSSQLGRSVVAEETQSTVAVAKESAVLARASSPSVPQRCPSPARSNLAAAPVRVISAPSTPNPVPDDCNSSMSTLDSNSSPAVLCRRGGVAFGHGPRANQGTYTFASTTAGIAMDTSRNSTVSSASKKSNKIHSPGSKKVPVHNIVGSAAKPSAPRQGEASRVDRKRHPSIPRAKDYKSSPASHSKVPAAAVSGVSRCTKRTESDGVADATTSFTSVQIDSLASVCGTETVDNSLLSVSSTATEETIPQIPEAAQMMNVSIQCDSFLLAAACGSVDQEVSVEAEDEIPAVSTASAPVSVLVDAATSPVSVAASVADKAESVESKPVMALGNRSSYDCFAETLDGALSLDGSHVQQQSATLDYSVDSAMGAQNTPPQYRGHSPIFMSYRKLHQGSDSEEDEMLEMGLEDLLAGSTPQASPIAKRHSFEESSVMALPKRAVEWEHSFVVPPVLSMPPQSSHRTRTTTPNTASTQRTSRTVSSRKSALGSAKRVSPKGEVQEHVAAYYYESENEHSASDCTSWQHSYHDNTAAAAECVNESLTVEESRVHFDMTTYTDAAVVLDNISAVSEVDEAVFDLTSEPSKAETTLTLDYKHPLDVSADAVGESAGPRLAVMQLKRDKECAEDIKEITFASRPGEVTTVELTIVNHHHKAIRMHSHAVSLRFEEYITDRSGRVRLSSCSNTEHGEDSDALTVDSSAPAGSFEVSPASLKVGPGQEGVLYVTFVPQADMVGVYSGVLKMRTKHKPFVMLLRGKALHSTALAGATAVATTASPAPTTAAVTESVTVPMGVACLSPEAELMGRLQKLNSSPAAVQPIPSSSPAPAEVTETAAPSATTQSPKTTQIFSTITINPDSLLLQKSAHCQRYEANLQLQLNNGEFSELTLSASCSALRLSRSRVILSSGNSESIKVLLDERSPELLQLCNRVLALDPAHVTTAMVGFISIRSASEGEYTVDVSITRSACFLLRQLQQQQLQTEVRDSRTPQSAIALPRPPLPHAPSQRPPMPSTRTSTQKKMSAGSSSVHHTPQRTTIALNCSSSVASVSESKKSTPARSTYNNTTTVRSTHSAESPNTMMNLAATLLSLRESAPAETVTPGARSQSVPRSVRSGSVCATADIRNFLRAKEEGDVPHTAVTSVVPVVTESFSSSNSTQKQQQTQSEGQHLMENKVGVYFRKECVNFGPVSIGSLTRANIELCNATDSEMTVYLGDPCVPFVLLHNEISIRPRSYVRVPVRYLPVLAGDYHNELLAQTADGSYHTKINLIGSAYV